jgi:molybdopterin synthase catalytic subunit
MFEIVAHPIDVDRVRRAVDDPGFGAILVFEGVARDTFAGRGVVELAYEAYAPMAVGVMEEIGADIAARWPGARTAIVHRVGHVAIGEPTVVIAVGTPHRAECYAASRHALEELKARVPVWKKEIYTDGSAWKANTTT